MKRTKYSIITMIILIVLLPLGGILGVIYTGSASEYASKLIMEIEAPVPLNSLHGSIVVSLVGMGEAEFHTISVSNLTGNIIEIDIKDIVSKWANHIQEFRRIVRHGRSVGLPTIWVSAILYSEDGKIYKFSDGLSSIQYYSMILGGHGSDTAGTILTEAIKKARNNPLAMFENRNVVRVKIKLREVASITARTIRSGVETSTAPKYFEKVIRRELYDSRNQVPEGWLEHAWGADEDELEAAWHLYAEFASKAYYYKASEYWSWEALDDVQFNKFMPEGIYDADRFIEELIYIATNRYASIDWINTLDQGTYWDGLIPYLSVKANYYGNRPVSISATFGTISFTWYVSGISFLGNIIIGEILAHSGELRVENEIITYGSQYKTLCFAVPARYEYVKDVAIVKYDIREEEINGTSYWAVVPYVAIVPYYELVYEDLLGFQVLHEIPSSYNYLVWNMGTNEAFSTTVYDEHIDYDESVSGVSQGFNEDAAAIAFNMLKDFISATMTSLYTSNPLIGIMTSMATSAFEFTHQGMRLRAVDAKFVLAADPSQLPYHVYVHKKTFEIAADSWCSLGVPDWPSPLSYEVDIVPSSTPGGPNTPLNNTTLP